MPQHHPEAVTARTSLAKKIARHHFGKGIKKIEFKPAGKTNFVYEAVTSEGDFIIRIAAKRNKMNDFIKEEWATRQAAEKGIPVPQIVEIGNKVIPFPYMIQQKIQGSEATDHSLRLEVIEKLGTWAKLIHSIPTAGFGTVFNWTNKKSLKTRLTWQSYLNNELQIKPRIRFLEKHELLSKQKIKTLTGIFEKIKTWKFSPVLNHCDLRLKNVIVNKKGNINAIIDWENCSSNAAPWWDLSIALHDLSIDSKQKFLEGYGVDFNEFEEKSYALTAFNLVNYVPSLERIMKRKDLIKLDLYKLRLNSSLDLFSL